MNRDSFIFYRSFFESINELESNDRIALFEAICAYALDGIEPTMKGPAKAIFMLIRPQLDANTRKYVNGCKGGRPPKKPNRNQTETKRKRNDNDNDIENENENENDNENDNAAGSASHSAESDFSFFGEHENVELTADQRQELTDKFERSGALIDEVSDWIHNAKKHVPDHYGLCIRWAKNAGWPKRRQIEPTKPIIVEDPLDPDEQARRMAEMRETLNAAISSG